MPKGVSVGEMTPERLEKLAAAREKANAIRSAKAKVKRVAAAKELLGSEAPPDPPPESTPEPETVAGAEVPYENAMKFGSVAEEEEEEPVVKVVKKKSKKKPVVIVEQSSSDDETFEDKQNVIFVKRASRKKKEAVIAPVAPEPLPPPPPPPPVKTQREKVVDQLYDSMFNNPHKYY